MDPLQETEPITWLMEGDPSIRWQVMRDILKVSEPEYSLERMRASTEGWVSQLLGYQDDNGGWGCGIYSPKWTSTTYTLLQLKRMGLDPNNEKARKACMLLLDKGFYHDEGINFFASWDMSETCVTGLVLSLLSYFNIQDERLPKLVGHLLKEQMQDGGWNCLSYKGATHSSFHTTLIVLEGLREFEKKSDQYRNEIMKTRAEAIDFLALHKFYKSHRTDKVFDQRMTRFSFPPRWRYDIMKMYDFLQEAKVPWQDGMADAAELIIKKRNPDGSWNLQGKHSGRVWFDMERSGQPSRWNTLRGLRILQWLEDVRPIK